MCVMARDDPHFRLRIPEALRNRIANAAFDNHRSLNAEIVARLEASFDSPAFLAGIGDISEAEMTELVGAFYRVYERRRKREESKD